jgi:phosphopantetheinyl transferase (holo-ACP synthase)
VAYYRATRANDLKAIQAASETQALTSGFALKEARVQALQTLANMMYRDLTEGFLWLDQVKALGAGPSMEIVDYEDFNTAEMQQLRGVFDDIAKELGHRKTVVRVEDDLTDDQRTARVIAILDAARARRDRQVDGESRDSSADNHHAESADAT